MKLKILKSQKRFLYALAFLSMLIAAPVQAYEHPHSPKHGKEYSKKHYKKHKKHHKKRTEEVPLDGGILTLLAAGGAAYFGMRKKQKK